MIRLRHMLRIGPSPAEIEGLDARAAVTFAPMDALADGLGGLDATQVRSLFEVERGSYNYFRDGDILLAKVTPCFENGKKAIAHGLSNGIGFATSEVHVLRPDFRKIDVRFLHFLLCSEDFRTACIKSMTGAGGLRRVSETAILDWRPKVTHLDAQRAIADFLDRETARIDRLMEKKQRLAELFAERRQAVITFAVTKGIDSGAQARSRDRRATEGDGGVSEVTERVRLAYRDLPRGWKLRRLKFFADIRNSNVDKTISEGEEPVRLCNYTDVYYNERITPDLDFMQGSATKAEITRFQLKRGQVLITKDSESWEDIGIPALVAENMPHVLCGYHLSMFDPCRALDGGFLAWLCRSEPLNDQFKLAANGVTRFGIGQYAMKNAIIALPSITSQRRIADFLDRETSLIDTLKKRTLNSIDRLKEYRSALITAAVTGQIDVTAWRKQGCVELHFDQIEKENPA
ncbi:MAG: hypothetical protein OXI66_18385 [Boseongicola sp.]|nr:hypothetical protein [Boseongicola sp.]